MPAKKDRKKAEHATYFRDKRLREAVAKHLTAADKILEDIIEIHKRCDCDDCCYARLILPLIRMAYMFDFGDLNYKPRFRQALVPAK